jgi:hypothetical protein
VPKDSQRPPDPQGRGFQQRCGKPLSIFMLSVALYSRAMQQHGIRRKADNLLFFLIDEMQNRQRKCSVGLDKLSQPPQVLL